VSYSGEHGAALAPDDIDALAQQARDGDRDALEQLLAEVRPRVLNISRGVLPYSGDAEDA
jgi:RNA polymerase sigma-70 factor (ECF subfamily)